MSRRWPARTLEERFWDKVDKTETCWNWTGTLVKGYGNFHVGRTDDRRVITQYAHRMSWVLAGRELVEGLQLDHLCRNTRCVRPGHLEQVTGAINIRRAFPRKDECPIGHEMTPENTIVRQARGRLTPTHLCRTCVNESQRRRRIIRRERAA